MEHIKEIEEKYALLINQSNADVVAEGPQVPKKKRTQRPIKEGVVIKEVSQKNSDRPVTRS